jgi:hypothetical protein
VHRRVISAPATRRTWTVVGGLALLATLGWVPFMGRTLSPDEGGMLMVAAQWGEGSSLYGDYWVDRPPALVALYALADAGGGPWALRTLGVLAVLATVVLAGLVGRIAAPRSRTAPLLTAAAIAALVATPLFGGGAVNGELLGMPFLLGGTVAALRSRTAGSWRAGFGWALLAGAAGAGAVLVKQNLVDVFVLVAALVVVQWRPRQGDATVVTRTLAGTAAGALVAIAVAIAAAASRGTDPGGLWEAVVAFRGEAAATIASSATEATAKRLLGLVAAFAGSGAPLLIAVLALVVRRPATADPASPGDLRWPAVAVLTWDLLAVYLGGSYWLHYLTGTLPGIALLAAAAAQRPRLPRRRVARVYGLVALSAACATVFTLVHPLERKEQPVIDYLSARARPGDTGVVAFGAANILQASGLKSPYPDLWSLPVRVHDPDLERFAAVLAGDDRPTWLVVAGRSLETWGVDASLAQQYVEEHYELVGEPDRFTVYHRKDLTP